MKNFINKEVSEISAEDIEDAIKRYEKQEAKGRRPTELERQAYERLMEHHQKTRSSRMAGRSVGRMARRFPSTPK